MKSYSILVIGLSGPNEFPLQMLEALQHLGHFVEFWDVHDIYNHFLSAHERVAYNTEKKPVSIKSLLYNMPDIELVLVSQSFLGLKNDVQIPVAYYHREINLPCLVEKPTYLLMNVPEMKEFIRNFYPQYWYDTYQNRWFPMAANPNNFNPNRHKDLRGLTYISQWEAALEGYRDYVYHATAATFLEVPMWAHEQGLIHVYNGGNIKSCPSFDEYRDYLERSKYHLVSCTKYVYITRRVMEAALAKTLNVVYIHCDRAEKCYNDLGFYHKKNCILFREKNDLKYIIDQLSNPNIFDVDQMIKNAYDLVLEKHTYKNRAKELIHIVEKRVL